MFFGERFKDRRKSTPSGGGIKDILIFSASFIITFYVLVTLVMFMFGAGIRGAVPNGPLGIIGNVAANHTLFFILSILLALVVAYGVSRAFGTERADIDPYSGSKVSDTGECGVSRPATEEELRSFYKFLPYDEPDGRLYAVSKRTGELITIPWKEAPENQLANGNVFLLGPSGSRKTSSELLPNIFNRLQAGHAVFATDTKGEIYQEVVAVAKYLGYKVNVFNCQADQFENSDGWDVLKYVREARDPASIARQIANIILVNIQSSGEGAKFWTDSNVNLFSLALLYVARAENFVPLEFTEDSNEGNTVSENESGLPYESKRKFGEVIDLISKGSVMAENIKNAIDSSENDAKLLEAAFNIWITNSQAEQIQSGLGIALSIFNNDNIKRVLSADEIDFADLDGKKTLNICICSDKDMTYKPLQNLYTTFMFKETMDIADSHREKSLGRPLAVFLEECGNIGEIPGLAEKVSTVRSRNITIFFCFQTIGQLKDTYSSKTGSRFTWETILANTAMTICVGSNDLDTINYLSDCTGTMGIEKERIGENYSRVDILKGALNQSHQFSVEKRKVFEPDQIQKLAITEVLLLPSGKHNPTIQNKYYYKDHPLYAIKAVDRNTGEEIDILPTDHVPVWRGGNGEDNFVPVKKDEKGVKGLMANNNVTNNGSHSFDDFL